MSGLTFSEYQARTRDTAVYPESQRITYPMMGLCGEVGELANKYQKRLRGDTSAAPDEDLAKELGDVLWFAAALAHDLGADLAEIAQQNLDKLAMRKANRTLKGAGDDR